MIDYIFGAPILKSRLPNHDQIKSAFSDYINNDSVFKVSSTWDCNCTTTFDNDKNMQLPWEIFFENVKPVLHDYIVGLNVKEEFKNELYATAWANKYKKGQHQEVHAHGSAVNFISCAYMLTLPENSGAFNFYNSSGEFFPVHMSKVFHMPTLHGKRLTPVLEEGDIIFFPSSLDHYVTHHKTDEIRASISANFCFSDLSILND